MKTFLTLIAILGLELWLCATYPDEVTRFFEFLPVLMFWFFIAVGTLALVLGFITNLLSPPASSPRPAQPPAATPPPARQPDTLTPLLVGLALGWWLGGGPGEGGGDC